MMRLEFDNESLPAAPQEIPLSAYWALVVLITIVASLARFHNLNTAPIWMDEAFTYLVARQPLDIILFNRVDNHPPLFYAIEHFWLGSGDLALLRVPAALLGIATVIAVTLATADLVSRRAGILAGALLAVSTSSIYMSQDARMYTLVAFGLALAIWAVAALGDKPGSRWKYAALYVAGASIAIYAQVIALIFLTIINGAYLAQGLIKRQPVAQYKHWFIANIVVLVVCAPWFLSLAEATATFPGLKQYSIGLLPWFFLNMIGFPGLPSGIKQFANLLLLISIVAGLIVCWRRGSRTLSLVSLGCIFAYPVVVAILNTRNPIMVNRIFLPCAVSVAMMSAVAIDAVRRSALFWASALALCGLGVISSVAESATRTKQENIPAALKIADELGFKNAPIITCSMFTGGTIYLTAPERRLFVRLPDGALRYTSDVEAIYRYPISIVRKANAAQLDRLAGGGLLVGDLASELSKTSKIVSIGGICDDKAIAREQAELRSFGFEPVPAPPVPQKRIVFESNWTTVALWQRR